MKTPKYKAWNIKYKRMDDVAELNWLSDGNLGYNRRENEQVLSGGVNQAGYEDEFILLDYIGLNDENGQEIYRGDIVKCVCREGWFIAVVKFGNPNGVYSWGWQLKRIRGNAFNPEILLWVETELDHVTCEVIGNIYENPELIMDGRRSK